MNLRRALVAASGLVVGLTWCSPAVAEDATALGMEYGDIDSRYAARAMRQRLEQLGYAGVQDLNGRNASQAHQSLRDSEVFAFFGHGNGAFIRTAGATDSSSDAAWLAAGEAHNPPYCTDPTDDVVCSQRTAYISQATYLDLDDTRLFIAGGCDTADLFYDGLEYGNFRDISTARGIDSFLGWTGTIYFPVAGQGIEQTNYSGNYFGDRLSVYLSQGRSYRVSVERAITDLVAKDGRAWGYKGYVFDGALSDPGAPTLSGAPAGVRGNGSVLTPVATPIELALPTSNATSIQVSHPRFGEVVETTTASGLSYRMTDEGSLLDLSGVPATSGREVVDHRQARAAALAFIDRHVQDVPTSLVLQAEGTISHLEGDAVSEFEWRPMVGSVPGPRVIRVEVDRRSGGVVSFRDVSVPSQDPVFTIGRDRAVAIATALAEAPGSTTAKPDIWGTSRWTVTVDRGRDAHGSPDRERIVIDARTGDVLTHAGT